MPRLWHPASLYLLHPCSRRNLLRNTCARPSDGAFGCAPSIRGYAIGGQKQRCPPCESRKTQGCTDYISCQEGGGIVCRGLSYMDGTMTTRIQAAGRRRKPKSRAALGHGERFAACIRNAGAANESAMKRSAVCRVRLFLVASSCRTARRSDSPCKAKAKAQADEVLMAQQNCLGQSSVSEPTILHSQTRVIPCFEQVQFLLATRYFPGQEVTCGLQLATVELGVDRLTGCQALFGTNRLL